MSNIPGSIVIYHHQTACAEQHADDAQITEEQYVPHAPIIAI